MSAQRIHKKIIEKASTFKSEFRKQTATAIMTAFGLVIAMAWKDVITDLISRINFVQGLLLSAVVLTAICVLGIIMINNWARAK